MRQRPQKRLKFSAICALFLAHLNAPAVAQTASGNAAPSANLPALSPDQVAQLKSQLHDLQLPEAIQWWPPAPGWWLLAALIICLGIGVYFALRPTLQRWRFRRLLTRELAEIRRRHTKNKSPATTIEHCANLLKRACLSHFPRQDVAGLTGQSWLDFLNAQTPTPCLSKTSVFLLTQQRFSGQTAEPKKVKKLLKDMARWIAEFEPPSSNQTSPPRPSTAHKPAHTTDQPQGATPA